MLPNMIDERSFFESCGFLLVDLIHDLRSPNTIFKDETGRTNYRWDKTLEFNETDNSVSAEIKQLIVCKIVDSYRDFYPIDVGFFLTQIDSSLITSNLVEQVLTDSSFAFDGEHKTAFLRKIRVALNLDENIPLSWVEKLVVSSEKTGV